MERFLCGIYISNENKALVVGYLKLPHKENPVFVISMSKFIDINSKEGKHTIPLPPTLFETTEIKEFVGRWIEGNNRPLREETYERLTSDLNSLKGKYNNTFITLDEETEKNYTSFLLDDYLLKRYEAVSFANFLPYDILNKLRI